MKKTMFITSVIMVVVMAIALTTSSLAWFSASGASEVKTAAVTISAQSNASEGLYIARDISQFQTGTIALDAGETEQYAPVVPYGTSEANSAQNFLYGLQREQFVGNTTKVEGGVSKWANNYSESNTQYYHLEDLYVANSGSSNAKVSASISIANTHGATLNVAVLARHERYTYDAINGDLNNNGVINGTLRIYTNEDGTEYTDYIYVGKKGQKEDNSDVYSAYVDQDNDGQITGEEQTNINTLIGTRTNISGVNSPADYSDYYAELGEYYNSESAEEFAARTAGDFAEAQKDAWQLLAYANSQGTNKAYLGKYDNTASYKTYQGDGTTHAVGTYYVLEKTGEADLWVLTSATETLNDAINTDGYAFKAADRLDNATQNNFFEENINVNLAYDTNGVQPATGTTAFTLEGTKRTSLFGALVEEPYGDWMQVRVIAWYSVDLSNSNSGAYDATSNQYGTSNDFTITFNRVNP